ncbi:Nicotinate nucleotide adenylyltransferase [Globisporangium polare]
MKTTTTTTRQVLLYGTSANPLTGLQGHMGAVAYCRQFVDEVWVLPVYQHIYSTKRQLAPFHHRVAMCKLAIKALSAEEGARVEVKECERELFEHLAAQTDKPEELRIGSIDLIKFLLGKHPDVSFTMLLGADTYSDLRAGKWKNGEELQQLVKLLVMDRKGVDAPWRQSSGTSEGDEEVVSAISASEEEQRVRFITIPSLSDLSSTQVRATSDVNALKSFVGVDVAEYIVRSKLFAFAE